MTSWVSGFFDKRFGRIFSVMLLGGVLHDLFGINGSLSYTFGLFFGCLAFRAGDYEPEPSDDLTRTAD